MGRYHESPRVEFRRLLVSNTLIRSGAAENVRENQLIIFLLCILYLKSETRFIIWTTRKDVGWLSSKCSMTISTIVFEMVIFPEKKQDCVVLHLAENSNLLSSGIWRSNVIMWFTSIPSHSLAIFRSILLIIFCFKCIFFTQHSKVHKCTTDPPFYPLVQRRGKGAWPRFEPRTNLAAEMSVDNIATSHVSLKRKVLLSKVEKKIVRPTSLYNRSMRKSLRNLAKSSAHVGSVLEFRERVLLKTAGKRLLSNL